MDCAAVRSNKTSLQALAAARCTAQTFPFDQNRPRSGRWDDRDEGNSIVRIATPVPKSIKILIVLAALLTVCVTYAALTLRDSEIDKISSCVERSHPTLATSRASTNIGPNLASQENGEAVAIADTEFDTARVFVAESSSEAVFIEKRSSPSRRRGKVLIYDLETVGPEAQQAIVQCALFKAERATVFSLEKTRGCIWRRTGKPTWSGYAAMPPFGHTREHAYARYWKESNWLDKKYFFGAGSYIGEFAHPRSRLTTRVALFASDYDAKIALSPMGSNVTRERSFLVENASPRGRKLTQTVAVALRTCIR